MKQVSLSGHRGAPEEAPENTASAFREALSAGADIIETDVRLTVDGHIVVSHDQDFRRIGGPPDRIGRNPRHMIESWVLDEGPEGPERPLFMDEALEMFPAARFNVDLKDRSPELVRQWHRLLVRTGEGHRCRTASFHDSNIRLFRRLEPRFAVGVARWAFIRILLLSFFGLSRKPRTAEEVLQIPERSGSLRVITPRRIALWHRYGWKIEAWTIDNIDDMRRLIGWGVDGIITNRPSLFAEAQS